MWQLLVPLFVLAVCSYGIAQEAEKRGQEKEAEKEGKPGNTVDKVLGISFTHLSHIMFPMATAMPDDKFGFAPTNGEFKGVRTFGEQLKHVAAANFVYASYILGEKPPEDVGENENGPASLKTKAEIVRYLNRSFNYVQKAVATINDENYVTPIKSPFGEGKTTRLALATLILGHCYDHYGQMVEYLRMNGIVPPASQR